MGYFEEWWWTIVHCPRASRSNDTAGRLEALLTSQRAFVADASHQLRTPLAALHIWLDNAADGAGAADIRHDLDRARQEVRRMDRLVGGLLALARAEATAGSRQPVDVAAVIADRVRAWEGAAAEASARIDRRVANGVHALLRPGTVEQVLDNLLDNAIGVGAKRVEVTADAPGARVALIVADDGPGLGPDERARAFDRFWRGPHADTRPGSGLGLAIVRRLVEDEGGSITLDDAPAGGSRFASASRDVSAERSNARSAACVALASAETRRPTRCRVRC